jgi:hypothetical protein
MEELFLNLEAIHRIWPIRLNPLDQSDQKTQTACPTLSQTRQSPPGSLPNGSLQRQYHILKFRVRPFRAVNGHFPSIPRRHVRHCNFSFHDGIPSATFSIVTNPSASLTREASSVYFTWNQCNPILLPVNAGDSHRFPILPRVVYDNTLSSGLFQGVEMTFCNIIVVVPFCIRISRLVLVAAPLKSRFTSGTAGGSTGASRSYSWPRVISMQNDLESNLISYTVSCHRSYGGPESGLFCQDSGIIIVWFGPMLETMGVSDSGILGFFFHGGCSAAKWLPEWFSSEGILIHMAWFPCISY